MAGGTWRRLRNTLFRRAAYEPHEIEQTSLRRCLSRQDVGALGVSATLGVGVYIIAGPLTLKFAGPSVVLSFLIGFVIAVFAALCFCEFSARIPRAGSAYSYTLLAAGEWPAFLVGWAAIVDAVFGSASVARALSSHTDHLLNATMSEWFSSVMPLYGVFFSPYFDFFAFMAAISMAVILAVGVKEGAAVNNVFVVLNLAFVLFIVVCGSFSAKSENWFIPPEQVPADQGAGGFFPHGVWGTLRAAAVCVYGFLGFESICATGEEVVNPRRVLPTTILYVQGVTFLCFSGVAVVVSMSMPYYMTGNLIAVGEAFSYSGMVWARWVADVGALFGLYASLFGCLFYLTRVVYSMCADGVLPRCLAHVTAWRQSPAVITAGCGLTVGLLGALVELPQLVLTLCLGTLLSYTAVAVCVLLLRYGSDYTPGEPRYLRQLVGLGRFPTRASSRIVNIILFIFVCTAVTSGVTANYAPQAFIAVAALAAVALFLVLMMAIQPQVKEDLYFRTPLVPLVPCISIYANIHLMFHLEADVWIRFAIWTAAGLIIYFLKLCFCPTKQDIKPKKTITVTYINSLAKRNGKASVQIIVESPTPPDTLTRGSNYGGIIHTEDTIQEEIEEDVKPNTVPVKAAIKTEEIIMHQSYIENNEEKEAKIIDLLDQVIQAEEDTYGEVNMKDQNENEESYTENMVQRKSLSELSDAGSDASYGIHGLSKYDVIAQVHREDLPRVSEEEERSDRDDILDSDEIIDHEQITAFNDNDSRTDESGYSDTIDRNALSESLEASKEEISNIPVPPPMPADENVFSNPNFIKSYTMGSKLRKSAPMLAEDEEINKPRESVQSVQSSNSLGEDNLEFGSDRQIHFMSKLNNIFQNKMTHSDDEEPRKRSNSTGNVTEAAVSINRERSPMFLALKSEIESKEAAQNLRPAELGAVAKEEEKPGIESEDVEDVSLSKEDLKSKLENIFAAGGPKLLKPRLMKSNPPTPEEAYHTDTSSTDSIAKLPKMEKNDTLKRQKDKFSEVLNSFRLSYNKDDVV